MIVRTFFTALALALPAASPDTTHTIPTTVSETPAGSEKQTGKFLADRALYFTRVDIDALMRAPVVDSDGKVVGSVDEIGVARDGRLTDAVVRVSGGLFGISSDSVTLEFPMLKVEQRGRSGFESYVIHAEQSRAQIRGRPSVGT